MNLAHNVRLNPFTPGGSATGSDHRDAAWLGVARALLLPSSSQQDLTNALALQVTDDLARWWTASPFEGVKGRRGELEILDVTGQPRHHDVTTLLRVATMSPHPWAWPLLVDHWTDAYATDGRRSPHPTWLRAEVRRSLVHLASPTTMAWWLDPANAEPEGDARSDRQELVNAWWRGLTRHLLYGKAENVVVSGSLPCQDVWAVFRTLQEQGLATLQDWSTPRNLAASRMGSHPNARADRALPLVMTPIEAVVPLMGSEPVLAAWLAEGGDPNLTHPWSRISLVQRALQCTTPTNLQALIDAGASLDVAAGAMERSNAHGRPAGVLGYPWCLRPQRFPTQAAPVQLPPTIVWPDRPDLGDAEREAIRPLVAVEPVETHLRLEGVLRWLTTEQTAVRLAGEVGVDGVWSAGAWQSWLEQRELRRISPPEDARALRSLAPTTVPRRRL